MLIVRSKLFCITDVLKECAKQKFMVGGGAQLSDIGTYYRASVLLSEKYFHLHFTILTFI